LTVTLYQRKPYTHCIITEDATGEKAFGIAKWNPNDKDNPGQGWDPVRGIRLAVNNAYRELLEIEALELTGHSKQLGTDLRKYEEEIQDIVGSVMGGVETDGLTFADCEMREFTKAVQRRLDELDSLFSH
jgi:hypothetical protein